MDANSNSNIALATIGAGGIMSAAIDGIKTAEAAARAILGASGE